MSAPMSAPVSDWKHNICSCTDFGTCLGSFFCYPCLFGRTAHRLEHYPQQPENTSFSWCNLPCVLMCCAAHAGFGWIPVWMQRDESRKKFGIKGNACEDCLASCCCTCCAMVQQENEVRERAEKEPFLAKDNIGNSGYQNQEEGMIYAPPPVKQDPHAEQSMAHGMPTKQAAELNQGAGDPMLYPAEGSHK